jgi:chromosome partitioning protein
MATNMTAIDETPETIAVSMQKGGTGKTFNSLNIAGGLNARGFNVLLVDLDPQGSLTANVGARKLYEDSDANSLDEVLLDMDRWDEINDIVISTHDEFDLIPANKTFKGNKDTLNSSSGAEKRLKMALEELTEDYHYIICDCPPDLSAYTKNAVTAGGNVVVPIEPRSEVVYSLNDLWESYEMLATMHDTEVEYLAYPLKYMSNKLTKQMKKTMEWAEENAKPLVKVDDRAAFDRAKWENGSIYNHSEALRNDQLPVFDEIVQLVLDQTTPPSYGIDVEKAMQLTPEDIRAQSGVN